jgi:phosphatidylserine decarboxylase
MSRVWGYVNSLELPVWFRPYGFRLYAFAFGCNLEEIEFADLSHYTSLGDFFYRKLKPGMRPVDKAILVSPADGTILHFGAIQDQRVEQVKGITYSLDALLGVERPGTPPAVHAIMAHPDMPVVDDKEFANVNGIEYSLDQLIGGALSSDKTPAQKFGERIDASVEPETDVQETIAHDASVAIDMGVKPSLQRKQSVSGAADIRPGNDLFFAVIYLAPGDYHRFHSPTAWVVEKRRHFAGELFSVSPYIAKRLENLFVLNERVALLGRWKHGFFSMVPVGATNVGSIHVNFDQVRLFLCAFYISFPFAHRELRHSAPTPNVYATLHLARTLRRYTLEHLKSLVVSLSPMRKRWVDSLSEAPSSWSSRLPGTLSSASRQARK